jgi:hypothetical protein
VNQPAGALLAASLLSAAALAIPGCSGGGGTGISAMGGSGGTSSATGGTAGGGNAGATAGAGHGGAAVGTGGTAGGGHSGDAAVYPNVGVCGRRGQATADATSFTGYEERYLIGEQGFGTEICVVRFDLTRVGDAPGGCSQCVWTHLLEYGNATVVTDTGGVCAKSDLALDDSALAKITGSRVGIGFAMQLGGAHGSARMTYDDATAMWDVTGNATWNQTSNAFKFDYREGICNYGP